MMRSFFKKVYRFAIILAYAKVKRFVSRVFGKGSADALHKFVHRLSKDRPDLLMSEISDRDAKLTSAVKLAKKGDLSQLVSQLDDISLTKSLLDNKHESAVNEIEEVLKDFDEKVRITPTGNIIGRGRYELLDVGWAQTLLEIDPFPPAFKDKPPMLKIEDKARFCLFSDFGTGVWKENRVQEVIAKLMRSKEADYSIHLGDVYYMGNREAYENNFRRFWPTAKKGNFNLNSNHDMYGASKGYFDSLSKWKIFEKQNGNSYFALENKHWILVGSDSAYYSNLDELFAFGKLNEKQLSFLRKIAKKGKKVIFMSHHDSIDITGAKTNALFDQVAGALGNTLKYWFFGHTHLGAVYKEHSGVKFRVIGHGAIPNGDPSVVAESDKVIWYERTPPVENVYGNHRVQNGFAILELDGENIREEFHGEDGKLHYSC